MIGAEGKNRARWSRSNHIFLRHVGAETKDVYFRINPQAIRVQQGGKGSVVDTLGGYFREVMYAEDPQHNGLLLPDLTIECETGAGYRKELERLKWIWLNHGTPKADGTPADTYLMDMADEDIIWGDGAAPTPAAQDSLYGGRLPQGTDVSSPPPLGISQAVLDRVASLKKDFKTPMAKTMDNTRFTPRAFKIALLNFSWDESVQDPYRIRFNFRCKILRDMFWVVDGKSGFGAPDENTPYLGDISDIADASAAIASESIPVNLNVEKLAKTTDYPLNIGAQIAMITRTLELVPGAQNITGQVTPILNQLLQVTGLGQNQPLTTAQDQGLSVYDPNQGQRLYWRSEFADFPQTEQTTEQIGSVLDRLPGLIQSPLVQTGLQVAGWNPATVDILSPLTSLLSLRELQF